VEGPCVVVAPDCRHRSQVRLQKQAEEASRCQMKQSRPCPCSGPRKERGRKSLRKVRRVRRRECRQAHSRLDKTRDAKGRPGDLFAIAKAGGG
jgi:hypothetical protein